MKKLTLTFILATISCFAMAGYVNHTQVGVDTAGRTAYGSMVGARNSADATQYIGCSVVNFGSPYALCFARNSAGTNVTCSTTNAGHIDQVAGLNNESYLYFQWDANGVCTYIYSQASSYRHE